NVRPRKVGERKRQLLDGLLCETEFRAQNQQGAQGTLASRIARGEDSGKIPQPLCIRFLGANPGNLGGSLVRRELGDFPRPPLAIGSQLIDFGLKLAALSIVLEQTLDFGGIDAPLGELALYEIGTFTNQLYIQHSECVPQQFNFQPLAGRVNRHDVKAHLNFIRAIPRRKGFRRAPHSLLLAFIDGLFGRARLAASPGFHLDEDQSVAVNRDEIDFCPDRAKIPRDDPVAIAPQMLFSSALATAAERKLRSKG